MTTTYKIDVDDKSAAELDAYAAQGLSDKETRYTSFNDVIIAYVKAELLAARAAKIVVQKPDISDASISASVDAVKV